MPTTQTHTTGDPFACLGVPVDADLDTVRRAFRRAALDTHPDRGGDAASFRAVRAAYDQLRTADLLAAERRRRRPATPSGHYVPPMPDVLAHMFGNVALDPTEFPAVRVTGTTPNTVVYIKETPAGWRPGNTYPSNACLYHVSGSPDGKETFSWGVWLHGWNGFVFGPPPPPWTGAGSFEGLAGTTVRS